MWVSIMGNLRWTTVIIGVSNVVVIILCLILMFVAYPDDDGDCGHSSNSLHFVLILLASCLRIGAMIKTGIAQKEMAVLILKSPDDVLDAVIRHDQRNSYKRWLWWTRFVMVITALQFVEAVYVVFIVAKHLSQDGSSSNCLLGVVTNGSKWQQNVAVLFLIIVCYVALLQCFAGSDVLRWRSFYKTKDNAWKAHYREVFDHGIREALCCMGRVKYLSVLEEDEVYSVAQLLGDLVAYRASGTGHLEFLAGLALLLKHSKPPISYEGYTEVPAQRIREAVSFHQFAEAAYTGLLLDIGRNPILFPCAWLYRQGILFPWTRQRRPVLEGDNWWRGHAAAFLKYANLSPEALRRGRVNQGKCKAAYFVVVLHHLKSIVIAVRGTETPEDLITDGLCRECTLSAEDLDGLINANHIHPDIRQSVILSSPHYGHSGIVEAARDLFVQIEGKPETEEGLLSSLLGPGCECEGYGVRIVGHSLGGAIAAMLGLRLYSRYANLHVYAYGPLPCVDSVIANACSEFVTSIVHDNEFSSRLSVASILRLRADAITTLSQATNTTDFLSKIAQKFLFVSNYQNHQHEHGEKVSASSELSSKAVVTAEEDPKIHISGSQNNIIGSRENEEEFSLWEDVEEMKDKSDNVEPKYINSGYNKFTNFFRKSLAAVNPYPMSKFMEAVQQTSSENGSDGIVLPEMFLAGVVIHIVPQQQNNKFHNLLPISRIWRQQNKESVQQQQQLSYRAYIAEREAFKDIIVSPSMFLDHLPWRCHYAMRKILEERNNNTQQVVAANDEEFQMV